MSETPTPQASITGKTGSTCPSPKEAKSPEPTMQKPEPPKMRLLVDEPSETKPTIVESKPVPKSVPPAPQKNLVPNAPTKRKSKINFGADVIDNEDVSDGEDEEKRAKMLLRTRRQSRGGGPEIRLEVKSAKETQDAKIAEVSKKVAQKLKVGNMIRSLKMTELEKYSKDQDHLAYLTRINDESKREINASMQEQLMNEILEILLITLSSYKKDLGGYHPVMEDIEERVGFIEDVLETQKFNREYEKATWVDKIKARASKRETSKPLRHTSQMSMFGNVFTMDGGNHTTEGLQSFRKSYANVNSLAPSMFVITIVCVTCAFISATLVYLHPPE